MQENSFTEAAELCHISQSGISRSIKALEDEIGAELIIRKIDGKLYFNTAEFFAKCDESGRGDETEGTKFTVPPISKDYKSANENYPYGK